MKTLSSSLALLQAEAQDPDSILVQAGDDRVRLVNDIVQGIGDTLRVGIFVELKLLITLCLSCGLMFDRDRKLSGFQSSWLLSSFTFSRG